ncbi:MAG: hypothetical protein D9V47_01065 [Clostridia bacterium]|nr:MAG: hypothetical protein D9V47_01065 [Clostridia bacterium]
MAQYEYWRRVESNTGYRKVEGYITVPGSGDISGVDVAGQEAAYNYFSMKVGSLWAEYGIYTAPSPNGLGGGKWEVFHNFGSSYGGWQRDNWPSGGIPPGTQVFMRLYVPADNQIAFYISFGSQNTTFTRNLPGTRYDGTGQAFRRLTTLLLNDPGGYSNNNKWRSVFIATPSDMHLWVPSDTAWVGKYPDTTRVSINTINQWYDEDISISAP